MRSPINDNVFRKWTSIDEDSEPSFKKKKDSRYRGVIVTEFMERARGKKSRLEDLRGRVCIAQCEARPKEDRRVLVERLKWLDQEIAKCA